MFFVFKVFIYYNQFISLSVYVFSKKVEKHFHLKNTNDKKQILKNIVILYIKNNCLNCGFLQEN